MNIVEALIDKLRKCLNIPVVTVGDEVFVGVSVGVSVGVGDVIGSCVTNVGESSNDNCKT